MAQFLQNACCVGCFLHFSFLFPQPRNCCPQLVAPSPEEGRSTVCQPSQASLEFHLTELSEVHAKPLEKTIGASSWSSSNSQPLLVLIRCLQWLWSQLQTSKQQEQNMQRREQLTPPSQHSATSHFIRRMTQPAGDAPLRGHLGQPGAQPL